MWIQSLIEALREGLRAAQLTQPGVRPPRTATASDEDERTDESSFMDATPLSRYRSGDATETPMVAVRGVHKFFGDLHCCAASIWMCCPAGVRHPGSLGFR